MVEREPAVERPYTYECYRCGRRTESEAAPVECPECGGRMKNLSKPRI